MRNFSLLLFFSFLLTSCSKDSFKLPSNRPNVILIIADDLGFDDLKIYNSNGLQTPNLEQLANEGVALNNGYVTSSVCSPSRAGLLSGKYQHRFGYYHNFGDNVPVEIAGIPDKEILISEYLKKYQYENGLIGKWHVGASDTFHPLNQGFDYFFGTVNGPLNYLPKDDPSLIETSWRPQTRDNLEENGVPVTEFTYLTDEFTKRAVSFIDENKDNPFFLVVSYNAPHDPWQTIAKYFDQIEGESSRARKIYLSMIRALDDGIGSIMDKVKSDGIEDNTIVIFLSDNGCKSSGPNICNPQPTLRGHKSSTYEGGIKVPFIIKDPFRSKSELAKLQNQNISSLDIYATIASLFDRPSDLGLDGMSFYDADESRDLFWEYSSTRCVLSGNDKLLRIGDDYELYNLRDDPMETIDLIGKNVELDNELKEKLEKWEAQMPPSKW